MDTSPSQGTHIHTLMHTYGQFSASNQLTGMFYMQNSAQRVASDQDWTAVKQEVMDWHSIQIPHEPDQDKVLIEMEWEYIYTVYCLHQGVCCGSR